MKIKSFLLTAVCLSLLSCIHNRQGLEGLKKPNVILIVADDQGYGDISTNGNVFIHTPNLDSLAKLSTQLTNFYVDPVCAPTRAALLTGKFYLRTGIYDTFNGGAIMDSDETTIAELFSQNAYQTGHSGKWHLGDHYPSRPSDQGFIHSLHHKAGGIGQPGDLDNYGRPDSCYFDPILYMDDQPIETKGYCADVFTEDAIDFIESNRNNPFFLYLAYNTPHTPLQVPEEFMKNYEGKDFGLSDSDAFAARKVYAMVENIDYNIGRILASLEEQDLMENTIIVYMSDNGPIPERFNAGLRGRKGSVYEGGIKVPFFIYYPGVFRPGDKIDQALAHIDVLPTLMELCGMKEDIPLDIDGRSFLPVLNNNSNYFQQRPLFWQWDRSYPDLYDNIAIRQGDYKLVGHCPYDSDIIAFELFNIQEDPFEENNLVGTEKARARSLKEQIDKWYNKVIIDEGNPKPQGVIIDTAMQVEYTLTRNDAKGTPEQWKKDNVFSYWDVEFARSGFYDITFHFHHKPERPGNFILKMAPIEYELFNADTSLTELCMSNCYFKKGRNNLEAYYKQGFTEIVSPIGLTIRPSKNTAVHD